MEIEDLKVGLKVRSVRLLSGVPIGTLGVVTDVTLCDFCVKWNRFPADVAKDFFSFNNLTYLEVV